MTSSLRFSTFLFVLKSKRKYRRNLELRERCPELREWRSSMIFSVPWTKKKNVSNSANIDFTLLFPSGSRTSSSMTVGWMTAETVCQQKKNVEQIRFVWEQRTSSPRVENELPKRPRRYSMTAPRTKSKSRAQGNIYNSKFQTTINEIFAKKNERNQTKTLLSSIRSSIYHKSEETDQRPFPLETLIDEFN